MHSLQTIRRINAPINNRTAESIIKAALIAQVVRRPDPLPVPALDRVEYVPIAPTAA